MEVKELEALIIEMLREVQTVSGREWTDLDPESKPLRDLDGFDSLSAVEVTAAIEQKLNCKFEGESIFTSDDGKRALSLKKIGDRIARTIGLKGLSK